MQRRTLLAALASAPLWPLAARANPHAGHGMPMHDSMPMNGMAAMHAPSSSPDALPPAGQPLATLPRLANRSTEAGTFSGVIDIAETRHALLPGAPTRLWSYNAGPLGPLIELNAGDRVAITLNNRLPEETTVHWHGLPVDPRVDGHPRDAIAPGGSFRAGFTLPDNLSGTFWYHPHPHGLTARQVAMSLAGPVIIRHRNDPFAGLPESLLVISDQRFDRDNQVAAHTPADWMDGREGEVVLVNGQYRPRLDVAPNETRRLRVLNACAARYLLLSLPGATLTRVGTDGGALARPETGLSQLLLTPGERTELLVTFPARVGQSLQLVSLPYARGKMMQPEQTAALPLMTVVVADRAPAAAFSLPAQLATIAPLGRPDIRRRVVLSERPMDHRMAGGGMMAMMKNMFLIDGRTYDMNRVDLSGKVGQIEEWEVVNDSHMDHPFHLHGGQFQLIARNGKPQPPSWRDTVNLAPRASLTLRVRFDTPGERLYHCHILEHEDLGMMGTLAMHA